MQLAIPEEDRLRIEDVPLRAADGRPLAARLHRGESVTGAVLVLGGTAIAQRYYARFSRHLARAGLATLTLDYRGVGRSRHAPLSREPASLSDWARLDAEAALGWLTARHGPVGVVAHSFGGQALGLLPSARAAVSRAVLVAAQSGWTGHWPLPLRVRNQALFGALLPLAARTLGHWPAGMGLGEGLPGGVAREWSRWCTSPGYLTDHVPAAERHHGALAIPIVSYAVADDDYAPEPAVEALLAWYARADVTRRTITPAALGVDRLGHFGLFRAPEAAPIWDDIAAFLART